MSRGVTADRRDEGHPAIRRTVLRCVWFALVTGLLQVAVWILARYVVHQAVFMDRQIIWTAPVANLVTFSVVTLLLLAARRWLMKHWTVVTLAVFITLACYTVLLMVPRIHWAALLILSIGAGVQGGRVLAGRAEQLDRLIRATAIPLVVLIVVGAISVNARAVLAERRDERNLPPAAAQAHNVLLIIWDTVRAASLDLYGYDRDTAPFLASFARAGVAFEWAFATAPWTLSSHGSMFTAQYPHDLTAGWDIPLDNSFPTVAEELAARGYTTGAFVANHIFSPPEFGLSRGFVHYEGRPVNLGSTLAASTVINRLYNVFNRVFDQHYVPEERSAENISRRFWRWRDRAGDRPYFAFLNYFDAHEPYTPPAPFDRQFGDPRVRRVINDRRPTPSEIQDVRDAYDGAIAYLDSQLRLLIEELERRGELDRTLIIITSDHGEHVGEHGLLDHGNTLYPPVLRVPLVISMSGVVPEGVRVAEPVSLRDIPRTIFDLLETEPATPFAGRSLSRMWDGVEPSAPDTILAQVPFAPGQPEWYPLARGDMRSLLLWPLHFIVDGLGEEQVFDLSRDPHGLHDLSPSLPPAALEPLREALSRYPAGARRESANPQPERARN